jgi:hypothetical protein
MKKKNPKVDGILRQETKWHEEFEALRTIALNSELVEELKSSGITQIRPMRVS